MRKRMVAVLLAAALASVVSTGCGKAKERVNEEGESVVTIWSPSDEPAIEEWWVEKIGEFNQAHEGEIELRREAIVRADSYAYEDKVNAAITSNDLPDILYVDGPNVSIYAANEVTLPLDSLFSEEEWGDFFEPSKQQNTYNGKIYAVGATESSVALYYNKDMLDQAGISVPEKKEDAWTWSEYYDVAKKLTGNGVVGTNIIMDKGEGLSYVLGQFWISNGTDFVNEDGSSADGYLNSKEGVEAAQFLNSLIQDGYANIDPIQKEFHNGRAATMLGGSWEVATLEKDYPDLNWGVTYFPVADGDGVLTSPTGDWAASVTKNAQDMAAVEEVMRFLFSKENVTTYAQAISKPPTRISSYGVLTEYNEYPRSIFKEQLMETGHPRPRTPSYSVLTAEFSEAMLNIFTGVDPQEALDAAAAAMDKDYAKYYAKD
ncbi:MAG: sugar ABC transporter substrate-binding protein [Lachnospiraceae bacterium]|jgi:fructooligosaccharide transport system substrate-binding protein|nr:sugar ABC transporter substrate-binding protein [Lachnospiraceae bacterium]